MKEINDSIAPQEFDDFFDSALCGFVITDMDGKIIRINRCAAQWLHQEPEYFVGKRFSDLWAVGGKIYLQTHLWPLLLMKGQFDEVALDLIDVGSGKMPVYLNGYVSKTKDPNNSSIRFTLFKAADRQIYEQNLQLARNLAEQNLELEKQNALLREQFIAVLGHDLRNPLGGIMMSAQYLAKLNKVEKEQKLIKIIENSSKRMHEMINSIMDFAHGRLGDGLPTEKVSVNLEELLQQLCDELKLAWPENVFEMHLNISQPVECDPARISQLVSNLLGNALTHGSLNTPVIITATAHENFWEICVTNQGKMISAEIISDIFKPFKRDTSDSKNNGLGLGLYIASEIAKAHSGTLSVESSEEKTTFTFRVELDMDNDAV